MSAESKISKTFASLTLKNRLNLPKSSVTQLTNIGTSVHLTTPTGTIVTVTATTSTNGTSTFTATSPRVSSDSIILSNIISYGGAGSPSVYVNNITQGSFQVVIRNHNDTSALNASMKIGYHMF
jgi:hypothetical protein